MGKRHGLEEIIGKLREAEIVLAHGGTTGDACRRIAVTEQTWRARKQCTNILTGPSNGSRSIVALALGCAMGALFA